MIDLPESAARNIRDAFENAEGWLRALPALLDDLVEKWSLQPEPNAMGNYSFVIPCKGEVLKLMPPGDAFDRELAAMLAWNGRGAAKIERFDPRGAMLIERLVPGTELTPMYHEGRDEEAVAIACSLMPSLAIPMGGSDGPDLRSSNWPTAADRAEELNGLRIRFSGETGPFPGPLVDAAEKLFRDLLASQGEPHLVHADLHHENILQSGRRWLAIDPHGLIAEREFEAYAWLNNPIGLSKNRNLKAVCERRLDQIADLTGFDRERIKGWGVACAVLSAWWSFHDHNSGYEASLAVAEALRTAA